mmetsp:Transcript_27760/g.39025  ORF Transcript_27760/g.39025 Transcript_27760/m.39025 type:complete len:181 (+) Transcript_27760:213-755(+)
MVKQLEIEFGAITADNVEQLRKVNAACFPVSYNDGFYKDVVARKDEGLNKFAYVNGFVVGAVCTRVEDMPSAGSSSVKSGGGDEGEVRSRLYIMTLGVLAAYRGRGIGSKMIASILEYYEQHKDDELSTVDEITLHVQTSNTDAMKFYTSRFGFVKGEMVENYYRRIDPPHCYILSKKLR